MTGIYPASQNTLFGISRGLESDERDALRIYLRKAWLAQYGQSPSTLSGDLAILEGLFRSHILGKRLRDAAEGLNIIAAKRPPSLSEAVFVPVDDDRGFVTPEGRVLLEQLDHAANVAEQVMSRDALVESYALIAEFYGESHRRWMRKELVGGDARPATLGFAVFLLINNSVGYEHALMLPSSLEEEQALAAQILPVVSEFSSSIGGSSVRQRETERLRSNWIVTEAKRQLGSSIARSDESHAIKLWVDKSREAELVEELGRQLARRRSLTASGLGDALDNTLRRYELARPMLASWGLAYERAGHTSRLFADMERAFIRAVRA